LSSDPELTRHAALGGRLAYWENQLFAGVA